MIKLHGLAGGEIVSGKDDRHFRVNASLHNAAEDADDAAGNVLDVSSARTEIIVVHRCKGVSQNGAGIGDGRLGIDA